MGTELLLQIAQMAESVVKDRCGQSSVGVALAEYLHKMGRTTRTPRSNHWNSDGVGYRSRQLTIKTRAGTVAIH